MHLDLPDYNPRVQEVCLTGRFTYGHCQTITLMASLYSYPLILSIPIIPILAELRNSLVMMLELEMEGRAVGLHLGLNDGTTATLEEVEPVFQGGTP